MTKNKAAGWVRAVLTALMALLTAALILARVGAEEAGYFYLTAVTQDGTLIVPEKLYYAEGATIREALEASGHTFTWQDGDRNMVLSVDGVSANYTRSDENGGFDLDAPAADISFFCFSVGEISNSARPAAGMQALIRAMADYADEEPDTRACAAAAYDAAKNRFITACTDDNMAYALAEDISDAVTEYLAVQNGPRYAVSFDDAGGMHDAGGEGALYSEANYPGVTLTAVNEYGKVYADEDHDGVIELVNGEYEFHIACRHNHVLGDVTVNGAAESVSIGMWSFDDWLDADNLRLSLGYGNTKVVTPNFNQGELEIGKSDHLFRVDVPDINARSVFICADYNPAVFSAEEAAAKMPRMLGDYTVTDTGEIVGGLRRAYSRGYDPNESKYYISMNSLYPVCGKVSGNSIEGGVFLVRTALVGDYPDYFRYQDYIFQIDRVPTLSGLKVTDTGGNPQTAVKSFSAVFYDPVYDYEYRVLENVEQVVITPTPFSEDYEVTVNGLPLTDGSATVDMMQDGSGNTVTTTATVTVSGGGYSRDYTLTLVPMEGKRLTFNTVQPGTTVQVFNKAGEELQPAQSRLSGGLWSYLWVMPEGETYSYVVTRDEYFHSTKTFTMEESANKTLTVHVIEEDWLDGLTIENQYDTDGELWPWLNEPTVFDKGQHAYELHVRDVDSGLSYTAVFDENSYDVSVRPMEELYGSDKVKDYGRSGQKHTD